MGLLDKFNESDSELIRVGTKEGEQVTKRAGAFNTSQIHAQGKPGEEAPGFGKINNEFIASTPEEAYNLGYKKNKGMSEIDLDGATPEKRAGAFNTSQIHAQGKPGEEAIGFGRINNEFIASKPSEAYNLGYKKTKGMSEVDLDGATPPKYSDNLPR